MKIKNLVASMGVLALFASVGCVTREEVYGDAVMLPQAATGSDAVVVIARDSGFNSSFDASTTRAAPGKIVFTLTNAGEQHHELAVVPFENGRYGFPIAEIESTGSGKSASMRVDLGPGSYWLVCLLNVEVGENLTSHLVRGMELAFEVTH